MKKLLAALISSAVFLSAAFAQSVPAPTIAAKSWILLDATSGQIIAAQEPNAGANGNVSSANTMPYIVDAVRAYATVGEICEALRQVYGTYTEVSIT